jgi:RNA polymerase sigma factor for flagellar operon FliA
MSIPSNRRDEMILSHLPQVELLAIRLHRRCPQVELDDLVSAGTIGLIHAVDRFNPDRGLKLKTFAEHRIRGAMLDYLRQIDPLPRGIRSFQKRREATIEAFRNRGEVPSYDQLAQALGVTASRYVQLSVMIEASQTLPLEVLRRAE